MHYANSYLERPVVGDPHVDSDVGRLEVLNCMLNTGSDIYQGACKKRGSTLKEEYKNASGTCYMDPRDMAKLGVKNWDHVLVKTDYGEVVVSAARSRDAPHEELYLFVKAHGLIQLPVTKPTVVLTLLTKVFTLQLKKPTEKYC